MARRQVLSCLVHRGVLLHNSELAAAQLKRIELVKANHFGDLIAIVYTVMSEFHYDPWQHPFLRERVGVLYKG
jgi:hypothetical protein